MTMFPSNNEQKNQYIERWYRLSRDTSLQVYGDGSATLFLDPVFEKYIFLSVEEMQRIQEAWIKNDK